MMSELKQRKLRNCNILPTTTIKIHMEGGEFKNQLSVRFHTYRVNKKNLSKFSDTYSVRADGLCIGIPKLVGGWKAGNSNVQDFFCAHCTCAQNHCV